MTTELVTEALENALQTRGLNKVLVLHSDRGKQYTADVYREYSRSVELLTYRPQRKGVPMTMHP